MCSKRPIEPTQICEILCKSVAMILQPLVVVYGLPR